jgi:hypothetical protein
MVFSFKLCRQPPGVPHGVSDGVDKAKQPPERKKNRPLGRFEPFSGPPHAVNLLLTIRGYDNCIIIHKKPGNPAHKKIHYGTCK